MKTITYSYESKVNYHFSKNTKTCIYLIITQGWFSFIREFTFTLFTVYSYIFLLGFRNWHNTENKNNDKRTTSP